MLEKLQIQFFSPALSWVHTKESSLILPSREKISENNAIRMHL